MDSESEVDRSREKLPPLNALRAFEVVARRGSFAAAAGDLHVTHWAVGKQIRLLENWFGVPLFERRARGVVLTDDGTALLADVSHAFERLSTGASRLRQERFGLRVSGVVRVNVLASFAVCWLLPRLRDFQARFPAIEISLTTSSRRLRHVGDACDIAVRSGPARGSGLASRTLMPDLRLPACSPVVLERHSIHGADDLKHHTLLHSASTPSAWSSWQREAGVSGLRSARQVEFEHVYLQLAAAVEGLGVALASWPLIERDIAAGRLVCPLAAPMWRAPDYTLVVAADRAPDAAVTAFEDWLVATAAATATAQAQQSDRTARA